MKVVNFLFFVSLFIFTLSKRGKDRGAYKSTPKSDELQYRQGNNLGYYGNKWDDEKLSKISAMAGNDGQRKKLPEQHLKDWGWGIELGDAKKNNEFGILDVIGYLSTPTDEHSSKANSNKELCYPANLYEPIWLSNGKVNPNNYWANFVNETVTLYKPYIKIWEVWNEPDYTQNYNAVGSWAQNPPEPKDLTHWYGTIFQYIRLLRITYEVAKKADPNCWVSTGGLGYTSFLDGILRYTDEPTSGKVTDEYPAYGGAYFDCNAFHQYPKYGVTDEETGKNYNSKGSDNLAMKVVILGKNHRRIIEKHGFGDDYPAKIIINTETGIDTKLTEEDELLKRNFLIKLFLRQIEYDIKQMHYLCVFGEIGDYLELGTFTSYDEGFKHLKKSSIARITMMRFHVGKFEYDEDRTKDFIKTLPTNMTGIVLKRKFPKEEGETYYYKYMYSAWLDCQDEEKKNKVETKLDLPFDPLFVDWEGNELNVSSSYKFEITGTPIFLFGDGGLSGVAKFFITVTVIVGIVGLAIAGLWLYKRFVRKRARANGEGFFEYLNPIGVDK